MVHQWVYPFIHAHTHPLDKDQSGSNRALADPSGVCLGAEMLMWNLTSFRTMPPIQSDPGMPTFRANAVFIGSPHIEPFALPIKCGPATTHLGNSSISRLCQGTATSTSTATPKLHMASMPLLLGMGFCIVSAKWHLLCSFWHCHTDQCSTIYLWFKTFKEYK